MKAFLFLERNIWPISIFNELGIVRNVERVDVEALGLLLLLLQAHLSVFIVDVNFQGPYS